MALLLLLLLLILLPLLIFFTKKILRHSNKDPSQLPSPPSLPLIGHLHLLDSLPHRSLCKISTVHGPVVLLHFGQVPVVIVSSAAAAEEVMKTRDLAFASRPHMRMADRLLYGTDIAFAPYGEYWRQTRRICVLHLLTLKRVQSFCSLREQEVSVLVNKIYTCIGNAAGIVHLSQMLMALTNDVVCRAAFGRKYSGGGDDVGKLLGEFVGLLGTSYIGELIPWLGWIDVVSGLESRVQNCFSALDRLLEKVICDHQHEKKNRDDQNGDDDVMNNGDFVDVLLEVNQRDHEVRIPLGMDSIKGIIMDMFAAGTDTVYTTIEWAMAELIKHPTVMRKLQDDVRAIVGKDAHVKEEHIERMAYLKCVVKETFRLHPPLVLLVPRETLEDTEIMGYHISARTRVMINAWAIGRDPKSWDRSDEFWPDRFLNSTIDFRGQDFELIPFGAGRRGCPGIEFAIPTIELTLASLMYHFEWELPDGKDGESLDLSEVNGISVHLKSKLVLVAKPFF